MTAGDRDSGWPGGKPLSLESVISSETASVPGPVSCASGPAPARPSGSRSEAAVEIVVSQNVLPQFTEVLPRPRSRVTVAVVAVRLRRSPGRR